MVEEKKTLLNLLGKIFSFLGKYTGISWVLGGISSIWKSLFGGKGAGKEGVVTPEGETPTKDANIEAGQEQGHAEPEMVAKLKGETPQKDGRKSDELTEKEVSEFVNSALELVKSNNALGKGLISQLESISQDRFKDILFSYCGSILDIRFKYFNRDKESRNLVLNKQEVGDLVKEKEFVQLLSQVKPEISIPKSAQASAAAKPEGNGMGAASQAKFSSDENSLLLVITEECYKDLKDNYQNKDKKGEFRAFVQCDGENLCITGFYEPQKDVDGGEKAISVTSVKNAKASEEYVKKELSEMKIKVGLDENRRLVEITKMSPKPFEPVVSSHKSAPVVKKESGDAAHKPKVEEFSEKIVPSFDGSMLELYITSENYKKLEEWKNPDEPEEFCALIECDNGKFHITGCYWSKREYHGSIIAAIDSVIDKDGKTVHDHEIEGVKKMQDMLGLVGTEGIEVTRISQPQVVPKVSSSESADPKLSKGKEPENRSYQISSEKNGAIPKRRPVSSGVKDGQKSDPAETLQHEPLGYIKKGTSDYLLELFVRKGSEFITKKDNKNTGGCIIHVTINGKEHSIISGLSSSGEAGEYISFPIKSIRTQDNKSVNLVDLLDLNGGTEAEITRISDKPLPEAEIPANGGQPSPSVTNTDPEQKFVFGKRPTW